MRSRLISTSIATLLTAILMIAAVVSQQPADSPISSQRVASTAAAIADGFVAR